MHKKNSGSFTSERLTTHGLTKHKLFKVHDAMKQRCYNKNKTNYHRYGGRGITICDEWKNNVKAFYDWSMKNGYKEGLSIDRINNDGNYEPSNCRWVNAKIQGRNKTKGINHITYKGKTRCLKEWSEILGIRYRLLSSRIVDNGWSIERAFNTSQKPKNKNSNKRIIAFNGETHCLAEWANILGIKKKTLSNRMSKSGQNWTVEKAFNTPVKK